MSPRRPGMSPGGGGRSSGFQSPSSFQAGTFECSFLSDRQAGREEEIRYVETASAYAMKETAENERWAEIDV
eukprot:643157-Hanusia_phi.AAC.4